MFQNADGSFNFDDDHVTHTETGEKVSKFVYGSVNFNVSVTYGPQVKNGVFIIFFSDRTYLFVVCFMKFLNGNYMPTT